MEDGDVHQQLHNLKDRVNALTVQYSPRQAYVAPAAPLSPLMPSGDAFTAQLHDVKAHINTLQLSIANCEASMRQNALPRVPEQTPDQSATQSRLSLPSGPIFWQLFNSLRSDFQTLDTRVAGLEQDVDALEDRVDRLEPDRVTPAASTASQEDNGGVQVGPKQSEDLLGASMVCLPELCSGEKDAVQMAQAGRHHSRISSLQTRANDAFEWQWPAHTYGSEHKIPRPFATPMFRNCVSHKPYGVYDLSSNPAPLYPEGVAFRDREIDRMDDQLRAVQESLQSTEALAAAKDTTMSDMQAQIENLQAENRRMAAQTARDAQSRKGRESHVRRLERELEERAEAFESFQKELQKKSEGHLQTISDRDFAIRYWQERCEHETSMYQHTIADRERALQRWEESYNAASDAWRQENKRAMNLSSRLDQYRSDRRNETEQIHVNYEREIDKLKEFCEYKDAVIVKQERVMARGGRLLEERDAEIDRLQRRLRVAEDDMQHEGRQQKRMARLLDETQTELERLRSVSEVKEEVAVAVESGPAAQEQDHTMAASTEAVDGGETFERSIGNARRAANRHDEKLHQNADESEASAREAARTGSPRRRRLRRHDSSRHLPHHPVEDRHHRGERRPSPPPRPRPLPGREDRRERFVADNAEPKPDLPDRRRARFPDDTMVFNPPLPAPVAARKMASEADLRGPHTTMRGEGQRRSLSKHQSMQELPGARRRLQAYVETEGESDAEKDVQGLV